MEGWILAAWWLLLLTTVWAGIAFARTPSHTLSREDLLAIARGALPDPMRPPRASLASPHKAVGLLALLAGFATIIGLFAICFMRNESEAIYLHFHVILVLTSAAMLLAPLFKITSPHRFWIVPLCVVAGLVATPLIAYRLYADLAWPRTLVEGRVDTVRTVGTYHDTRYQITLDGRNYMATHTAMQQAEPGARVTLERGAGTGMVYALTVREAPAQATPMGAAFDSGPWRVQAFAQRGVFHHCLMWSNSPVDFVQAPDRFLIVLRTATSGLPSGTFGVGVASGDVSRHVAGTALTPGTVVIPLPGETALQQSLASRSALDFRLPGPAFRVVLADGHAAALARLAACAEAQGRGAP